MFQENQKVISELMDELEMQSEPMKKLKLNEMETQLQDDEQKKDCD